MRPPPLHRQQQQQLQLAAASSPHAAALAYQLGGLALGGGGPAAAPGLQPDAAASAAAPPALQFGGGAGGVGGPAFALPHAAAVSAAQLQLAPALPQPLPQQQHLQQQQLLYQQQQQQQHFHLQQQLQQQHQLHQQLQQQHQQPPPVLVIGTDSTTVKIRGLPFRATPLEILTFFDGYALAPESLQLGVDALGRPSGEAWLSFATAAEALRAVRERNRHYLGSRYLELSLT